MKYARGKAMPRAASIDAEAHALTASTEFQTILAEGRTGQAIPLEELDRQFGPLTDVQKAHAHAHIDASERLEEEQGAGVTAEQDRLIDLVLTALDYQRHGVPLKQLAKDSGLLEAEIRAVAAALAIALPNLSHSSRADSPPVEASSTVSPESQNMPRKKA